MKPAIVTLCTCPDNDTAEKIAKTLVEGKLAACVNILPGIKSVYQWQGKIETANEILLLIKSSAERYPDLEIAIRKHHPYEIPEIIALPIGHGLADYLDWIHTCHA